MSGATGLAAARRRRAGGTPTQSPVQSQSQSRAQSNLHKGAYTVTDDAYNIKEAPKPVQNNPLKVLFEHDKQILLLTNDLQAIKKSFETPVIVTPNDIQYYKDKYEELLLEVTEIKKSFLKVQTNSVESNLVIMKIKKQLGKTDAEIDKLAP